MDLNKEVCPKCGVDKTYSKKYDSYYCQPCNEWLDDICNDRECLFCRTRPVTPNEQNLKES